MLRPPLDFLPSPPRLQERPRTPGSPQLPTVIRGLMEMEVEAVRVMMIILMRIAYDHSEHGNKIVVIMDGCPLMVLKGDGGIRNKLG